MKLSAAVCALALVLAGCLAHAPPEPDENYRWGLGLDLRQPWPVPGEYREPADEIAYWESARPRIAAAISQSCSDDEMYALDAPAELWSLLFTPYMHCSSGLNAIEPMKTRIERTGNYTELEQLRRSAANHMESLRDRLSSLTYKNISSVQVAALLMASYVSGEEVWSNAETAYHACQSDCTGEALFSMLLDFDWTVERALAIGAIADFIDAAGEPACHAPAAELHIEIAQRTGRLIGGEIDRDPLSLPDDGWDIVKDTVASREYVVTGMRVVLADVLLPRAENAAAYGWWPLELGILTSLGTYEAFFVHAQADKLPMFDEARYLHAVQMSGARSIWTDHAINVRFSPERESGTGWTHRAETAIFVLSFEGLEWRFDEADCG